RYWNCERITAHYHAARPGHNASTILCQHTLRQLEGDIGLGRAVGGTTVSTLRHAMETFAAARTVRVDRAHRFVVSAPDTDAAAVAFCLVGAVPPAVSAADAGPAIIAVFPVFYCAVPALRRRESSQGCRDAGGCLCLCQRRRGYRRDGTRLGHEHVA